MTRHKDEIQQFAMIPQYTLLHKRWMKCFLSYWNHQLIILPAELWSLSLIMCPVFLTAGSGDQWYLHPAARYREQQQWDQGCLTQGQIHFSIVCRANHYSCLLCICVLVLANERRYYNSNVSHWLETWLILHTVIDWKQGRTCWIICKWMH